jgi:hypothetical protein
MGKYNLVRVDAPIWVDRNHDEDEALLLGGQREWAFNTPAVFQALAAPQLTHSLVRAPTVRKLNDDRIEFNTACGYWTSLLNVLIYSFGWSQPGIGLDWWLQNGRPTDDARLDLISQVWLKDGQLQWFEAWVKTSPYARFLQELINENHRSSGQWITDTEFQLLELALNQLSIPNPFSGGGDPLHLSHHASSSSTGHHAAKAKMSTSTSGEAHAVLLIDGMTGWYHNLFNEGNELGEHPSGRSWKIDVVAKQVGHLGTFRRSRETGLWFAGPHSLHVVGNPPAPRS